MHRDVLARASNTRLGELADLEGYAGKRGGTASNARMKKVVALSKMSHHQADIETPKYFGT